MTEQWLLLKRDLYWRPGDLGYTGIRDHAGRYSFDEAKARVGTGESGVSMVKESEAPEFTGACFDDLAREHLLKQRDELRVEVRRLAIARHHRMVAGGGFVPSGGSCELCNSEWEQAESEGHAAGCLATPR